VRLDQYLVERGYYETREQAKRAILAGEVELQGRSALLKPGERVGREEPEIHIRARPPFVSRAGNKLCGALEAWGLRVEGLRALDVGSSTGGFTDCLLQKGASEVIALDVGKGQLHWKLRNDERVHVLEGFNARFLSADDLPFQPDLAVIDVSFISLVLVLRPLVDILKEGDTVIALVKPQFEAGREQVGKGGVVRDAEVHREVLAKTITASREMGFYAHHVAEAQPRGRDGNREFVLLLKKGLEPEVELDYKTVCEEGGAAC
jgi:23S rRNA (cytidine1920-2'-O)/16S rRNA (cytidine1409-2'-O)-methyltransferase